MTLVSVEASRPSGIILSRSGEISASPPRIEVPLRPEMVRVIGEGKGIDLRYDLRDLGLVPGIDGYRDYEVYSFEKMVAKAVREGEDCIYFGPLVTDLILPNELFIRNPAFPERAGEFAGFTRWDFFKLVGNRLAEVDEVKIALEFMEEYRKKVDEENGLPGLMGRVKEDFSSRIKKVIAFTYVSGNIVIDPSTVTIRFISPTRQEQRTNFDRPRTPHEHIEPTAEIEAALINIEEIRRASAIANKKEKARLAKEGVLVQFPAA